MGGCIRRERLGARTSQCSFACFTLHACTPVWHKGFHKPLLTQDNHPCYIYKVPGCNACSHLCGEEIPFNAEKPLQHINKH